MTNIQLFTFNQKEVRTIVKPNNSIWFVASDIAKQLEYRDASNLVRLLDNDEADTHNMSIRSENGTEQSREVSIINESGLYHAIFKSRKTEAKAFRKWVTSEVLPSIRKTGSYDTTQMQTLEQNIKTLEQNNTALCNVITKYENQLPKEMAKKLCNLVKAKVNTHAPINKNKSYSYVWSKLKDYFSVTEYRDIPQIRFGEAVEFISSLQLPKFAQAEQMEILEPNHKSKNLINVLSNDEVKQAIFLLNIAPQIHQIMVEIESATKTLLIPNSVARNSKAFTDEYLQNINQKARVIETLLKNS